MVQSHMISSLVFITILCMMLYLFGHCSSSYSCVACTCLSTISNPCPTQIAARHAARVGIWVTNALIMPLHLEHLGSSPATTLPHAGLVITLTPLYVLRAVTTSAKSWKDYSTFEQLQRHLTRTDFSDGYFSSGPPCLCALHVSYSHVFLLSAGFSFRVVVFSTSDGQTFFILVYRTEHRRLLRAQHVDCGLDFLEQANGIFASCLVEVDLAKIALSCHFALDLHCYEEEVLASAR